MHAAGCPAGAHSPQQLPVVFPLLLLQHCQAWERSLPPPVMSNVLAAAQLQVQLLPEAQQLVQLLQTLAGVGAGAPPRAGAQPLAAAAAGAAAARVAELTPSQTRAAVEACRALGEPVPRALAAAAAAAAATG
jgi:hypothetical protein